MIEIIKILTVIIGDLLIIVTFATYIKNLKIVLNKKDNEIAERNKLLGERTQTIKEKNLKIKELQNEINEIKKRNNQRLRKNH